MIYKVDYDSDNYMTLNIPALQLVKILKKSPDNQDNFSFKDRWKNVTGELIQKKPDGISNTPDVTVWNHCLAFSQKGYDLCSILVKGFGEFLPVKVGNEDWYVFNILNFRDDLIDPKKSKQEIIEGDVHNIKSISFVDNEPPLLFRTHFDKRARIFCNGDFKSFIKDGGICGLNFSADLMAFMH